VISVVRATDTRITNDRGYALLQVRVLIWVGKTMVWVFSWVHVHACEIVEVYNTNLCLGQYARLLANQIFRCTFEALSSS